MRLVERIRHLNPVSGHLLGRKRASGELLGQGLSFQKLHDEVIHPVLMPDVIERADVRMRQGGDRLRLPFEALTKFGVLGEMKARS